MLAGAQHFIEKHVRLVPWLLNTIVICSLGASLAITIGPLYKYAVSREMSQATAARAALDASLNELLHRASVVADMMSYDDELKNQINAVLKEGNSRAVRKLLLRISSYEKNGRLKFAEVIKPDGKVLVNSSLEGRADQDVSGWHVFKETNELKSVSSLTKIDGRIFAAASANVRVDGTVVAVVVAAYELDANLISEWSKDFTTALTVVADNKVLASTMKVPNESWTKQDILNNHAEVLSLGGARYAVEGLPLVTATENKKEQLGKVYLATSLEDFFSSLKSIGRTATVILMPLVLIAVAMVLMLGKGMVSFTQKLQKFSNRLVRILTCTQDLAVVHDRILAARKAVQAMLSEIPTGEKVDADVYLHPAGVSDVYVKSSIFKAGQKVECVEVSECAEPAIEELSMALLSGKAFLTRHHHLIIPIMMGSTRLGFVLIHPYGSDFLASHEADFVTTLASSLAISLENISFLEKTEEKAKLEGELQAAKAVQEALLPNALSFPGLEIAASLKSATSTGGDWYGYHYDKYANRMYFFVGDVTGHGVPSALITGVVCGAIYAGEKTADIVYNRMNIQSDPQTRLLEIAKVVNEVVVETGSRSDRFMTMCFMSLDLVTGELVYVNAGHNHPFWIQTSEGQVRLVPSTGSRLGYTVSPQFTAKKLALKPDDCVFIYTDGLIENKGPDDRVLTEKQIKSLLQNLDSPGQILRTVEDAGKEIWCDVPPADDVSMFVFKWKGPTLPHEVQGELKEHVATGVNTHVS